MNNDVRLNNFQREMFLMKIFHCTIISTDSAYLSTVHDKNEKSEHVHDQGFQNYLYLSICYYRIIKCDHC